VRRYDPDSDVDAAPEQRQIEDAAAPRQYKRATPHDALAVYGPLVKVPRATLAEHNESAFRGGAMPARGCRNPAPTRLLLNGGLAPEEAAALVGDGLVDAAVFGVLWIGNPDLRRRLERGQELNRELDERTLYDFAAGQPEKGYTDYPEAI
jgi:2,4-dienoyl-CoA reductase-like NADH-dependent reductase (Old Yellow Enzyme family)